MYLLVLTVLFCASVALLWHAAPRTVSSGYQVSASEAASDRSQVGKVNINTADAEELDTLPGIGPVLAARIVAWRTENGAFKTAEELLEVEGIGPSTLENLRESIITEETE